MRPGMALRDTRKRACVFAGSACCSRWAVSLCLKLVVSQNILRKCRSKEVFEALGLPPVIAVMPHVLKIIESDAKSEVFGGTIGM